MPLERVASGHPNDFWRRSSSSGRPCCTSKPVSRSFIKQSVQKNQCSGNRQCREQQCACAGLDGIGELVFDQIAADSCQSQREKTRKAAESLQQLSAARKRACRSWVQVPRVHRLIRRCAARGSDRRIEPQKIQISEHRRGIFLLQNRTAEAPRIKTADVIGSHNSNFKMTKWIRAVQAFACFQ